MSDITIPIDGSIEDSSKLTINLVLSPTYLVDVELI